MAGTSVLAEVEKQRRTLDRVAESVEFDRYRPYVTMMHHRARASEALAANDRRASMVIDACRPYEKLASFPKVAQSSRELAAKVRAKFPDLYK